MKVIASVCLILCACSWLRGEGDATMPAPTVDWHRQYKGSGEESHPHYVIETRDGGFCMVGETGFIEDLTARIFVVKTDEEGKLLWKNEFGRRGYNLGNCVVEAADGHLLVVGTLDYNAALLKLNAGSGDLLWKKEWDLGTEDSIEGVDVTAAGEIVLTGYRDGLAENTFLNWGKGVLIQTDKDGNEMWRKDISDQMCSGYRVKVLSDGLVISGHPRDEEHPEVNLLKTNLQGELLWSQTYGCVYWGFDVDRAGNMIQAGHTRQSPLSKNWDVEIKKVDAKGNELWTRHFGQPRGYDGKWIHDEVWGARATPDGGWLVVAGTGDETRRYEGEGHSSGPSGQWKVYLIKTDVEGKLEWEGIYGSAEEDWAGEDVCLTRDGGALVATDCGMFGFTKLKPFLKVEGDEEK